MTRRLVTLLSVAALLAGIGWSRGAARAQAGGAASSSQAGAAIAAAAGGLPGALEGNTATNVSNGNPRTESAAVRSMQSRRRANGPHLCLTVSRSATDGDRARAASIAATLRESIERYKDYRMALADGYRIFMPNVPQPEYHFTNYWNGYLEGFTFDPARPTSLLYRKNGQEWQLVGAMYTAPRSATPEELNERVPLGVARWHSHTNLCMPKGGTAKPDWKRFGLEGSISNEKECQAAGGNWFPQVFGWMVHVYPYESTTAKMFQQ